MAGDIFYSSVDKNLRSELDARAGAGFSSRDYKQIDFMLSKITNVEVTAYSEPTLIPTNRAKNKDGEISRFAILGGRSVQHGPFNPSAIRDGLANENSGGYLTKDRLSNRIPPVITLAEINIGDHSMALLNKATFNVLISDPSADLNEFEQVWFKPGRNVEIRYEGSKDQIITYKTNKDGEVTNGLLTPPSGSRYKLLTEKYGSKAADKELQFRKMNEVTFAGVITSFTFSYLPDGTVEATIMMSGTSNIFTDVSLMLPKKESTPSSETNTFRKYVDDYVSSEIKKISSDNLLQAEIKLDKDREDLSIICGSLYQEGVGYFADPGNVEQQKENEKKALALALSHQYKYISLGLLIDLLNDKIISKLNNNKVIVDGKEKTIVPFALNAQIICNDEICQGRIYNDLVSADPTKILLWEGKGDSTTCTYPSSKFTIVPPSLDVERALLKGTEVPKSQEFKPYKLMPKVEPETAGFQSDKKTFPSRIYIGLETVIKKILADPAINNVQDFLKQISTTISRNTGGIIKMALITDPAAPDKLLYYNTNFIGSKDSIKNVGVNPYIIPMSARSSLDTKEKDKYLIGSIVTDAKISSKLPENLKSLAFVLNEGSEISKSQISPFVTYMYADGDVDDPNSQKGRIAKSYEDKYREIQFQLEEAKCLLTNDYVDLPNIQRLRDLLYKYNQYPTKSIKDTNVLNAPVFIFDAEITIEGIQGFRIGDVVQLPVLPFRYRTQAVFSVIGITHTVDSAGVWRTKIKLVMRPKTQ